MWPAVNHTTHQKKTVEEVYESIAAESRVPKRVEKKTKREKVMSRRRSDVCAADPMGLTKSNFKAL